MHTHMYDYVLIQTIHIKGMYLSNVPYFCSWVHVGVQAFLQALALVDLPSKSLTLISFTHKPGKQNSCIVEMYLSISYLSMYFYVYVFDCRHVTWKQPPPYGLMAQADENEFYGSVIFISQM